MNYGNATGLQQVESGYAMDAKMAYTNRTIGENIDARIKMHEAEIARLKAVQAQLTSGASLLDVRIEDLRQAMNY